MILPGLFQLPVTDVDLRRLSPGALAYLGDAVYELYVRSYYLWPPGRAQRYHHQVVAQVNATAQANHLQTLESHLTPQEQDILRRGRNAAPRRKGQGDPQKYQQATGFETLIGYLYLANPPRLQQVLNYLVLPPPEEASPPHC
ncbi:MAG: ribonuclease III domain-containing protein [Cyanobacteria bacterium J06635_15]